MADSSEYPDDAARIERDYVSPDSATQAEVQSDLEAAGFEGKPLGQFSGDIVTSDEVVDEVSESRGITTRETVEDVADSVVSDKGYNSSRSDVVADEAAKDLVAPSSSEVDQARQQAVQNADLDEGVLRSNPDLDPAASGGEGREIIDIEEAGVGSGQGSLGQDSPLRETVERTGEDTATFSYEVGGQRYPVAEVDL